MKLSLFGPSTIRQADVFLALSPSIGKKFRVVNHAVKPVTPCSLDRDFGWLVHIKKYE
jgi:hypothetical protein